MKNGNQLIQVITNNLENSEITLSDIVLKRISFIIK